MHVSFYLIYRDKNYLYNVFALFYIIQLNRCKEFYEGPNCEIELKRSIVYEKEEIPSNL